MNNRLGEIQIRTAMATPAPLEVGIIDPELDPVQWFKEHLELADDPTEDVWVVWCPKHPKSEPDPEGRPTHAVLAAITGNGPTSEHNAEFFAHAREDIPWLLFRLEQSRQWSQTWKSTARYHRDMADKYFIGYLRMRERFIRCLDSALAAFEQNPLTGDRTAYAVLKVALEELEEGYEEQDPLVVSGLDESLP